MSVATAVKSVIDLVTVYARGARVRRTTTLNAPVPRRLHLEALPLAVIDDTVRVEVDGPAVATAVRVTVDAPSGEPAVEESAPLREVRRQLAVAEAEVERLMTAVERLAQASVIEADPSDDAPAPWATVLAARRSVVAVRAERELALRDQLAVARRTLDEARRLFEAAADRDRRDGKTRPAKVHELRKRIEVELAEAGNGGKPITIRVEYLVAAARWAPSYVARLDGERALVEVRAVVAQDSGEDWAGVPLKLSTAEPTRFSALPELAAQRIGRRQHELTGARGFRAPPTGAEALFADFDRLRRPRRRSTTKPQPITSGTVISDAMYVGRIEDMTTTTRSLKIGASGGFASENWDEESSRAKEAFKTPPKGAPALPAPGFGGAPPPAQAAPSTSGAALRAKLPASETTRGSRADDTGGGASVEPAKPAPAQPVPRLDYGNLRMAVPSSHARGSLIAAEPDPITGLVQHELAAAHARIVALPLPSGCHDDWAHTYDYAFTSDGAIDVKSDGAWHSVAVTAKASTAKLHHVAVPREQADAFRIGSIANPFQGPLLPGPIDVYDRGKFLVTSSVDFTPPGATVEIGLGVDPAIKIARNSTFREEAAGMLRGRLELHHAITIDIDNLSPRAIDLEVRERIPVPREAGDDDIEVTLGRVEPAWERWTPDTDAPRDKRLRGGHRWRIAVPAGKKQTLRASYEVKIATKLELVGGNRRES